MKNIDLFKFKFVFIIVLICSLLIACSQNETEIKDERIVLLHNYLNDEHKSNASNITIHCSDISEKFEYVMYTFTLEEDTYEGVATLSNNSVLGMDYTIIDTEIPFTNHQFIYEESDTALYTYYTGVINDLSIENISIYFSDNSVVAIESVDGKYFSYLKKNVAGVDSIQGLDSELNLIYEY